MHERGLPLPALFRSASREVIEIVKVVEPQQAARGIVPVFRAGNVGLHAQERHRAGTDQAGLAPLDGPPLASHGPARRCRPTLGGRTIDVKPQTPQNLPGLQIPDRVPVARRAHTFAATSMATRLTSRISAN